MAEQAPQSGTYTKVAYQESSPTFLSQQPNSIDPVKLSAQKQQEWNYLRGHLEARLMQLRNWRESWWTQTWANLAQYILPRRSIWLTQSSGGLPTPNNMTRGKELTNAIKDPTATFAARVCSAGLMSGLASPSRPWFKVVPALKNVDIPADGKEWMDEVEERLYTIMARSNFYNSFAQECEDLTVFGTAVSILYEDKRDVFRCYNPVIGEYYLGSDATMRIDCLDRTFVQTVSQVVGFFGLENCPPEIQKLWEQKGSSLDKEVIIAHSIEPNFEINGCPKLPGNFTWREVYWTWGSNSQRPLSIKGFVDQPFTAARWSTQSNDAYGRGAGQDVLPDVIQLQVETVRKAEGIEKGIRPPLIADISMKNQPSSILPGHVTYVQNLGAGTGMRAIYETNFDLQWISKDIMDVQQRIKVGFFNDLFLMLEQSPDTKMTAYEVAQKMQEKLAVLGPVIENILTDGLKPKLERIYNIADRKGMIPPKPDSMKDIPIDVEFISMLAMAQKASATGGLERIAALIGNMVAIYPEAKDKLNVDNYIDEMNMLLANPEKILNSAEELKKKREAQAQQNAAQQALVSSHAAASTAKVGADAANVLSDTQIGGGGDALSMLLGTNA